MYATSKCGGLERCHPVFFFKKKHFKMDAFCFEETVCQFSKLQFSQVNKTTRVYPNVISFFSQSIHNFAIYISSVNKNVLLYACRA